MKKSDWQYLVDTLLFLCIIGITFIGFLMGLFLPQGPAANEIDKYFLGLHRHQWGDIHLYLSIAFVVLLVIHLTLSWKWIKGKSQQLFKKRGNAVLGGTAALSVLVILIFWAFYPKYPGVYEGYGVRAGEKARNQPLTSEGIPLHEGSITYEDGETYILITGQTTLGQIEKATGIPVRDLAEELNFPKSVSKDETFGQLRKKYGVNIVEVRDVISRLLRSASIPMDRTEEIPEKVEPPAEEHEKKLTRGISAEDQSGILITGRMTLREIGRNVGISARRIADRLRLPSNISLDQTLGRLRRRYGFTIQNVRDAIASLMEKK